MQQRRTLLTLLAMLPAAARAQGSPGSTLNILASFTILADFARAIGGARLRVASLVGPNQDAHRYQPRPSDLRAVTGAAVMISNGLGYEGWVERLVRSAGFKGVAVVASTSVAPLRIGAAPDPHAWQDVANAKIYVGNIRDALSAADPAHAAQYAAGADAYLAQLQQLDAEMRAAWAQIARATRRIVTSHDAFTYYGAAYGVDFFAPQGIAEGSDPTPRQLAALIAQIRTQNIRALFVESISNAQILRQVARETGVRIGPAVYSDALSDPTGPAGSYLDMMRHNTRSFIGALG